MLSPVAPWHLEHALLISVVASQADGSCGTTHVRRSCITSDCGCERDRSDDERVDCQLSHQKSIHSPTTTVLLFDALGLVDPARKNGFWLLLTTL